MYPKLVPVSSAVCKFLILSQHAYKVDRPCYVTVNPSTLIHWLYAFDFDFINLEPSQLLQTGITPEKKCSNGYCLSLAFFMFPSCSLICLSEINIRE